MKIEKFKVLLYLKKSSLNKNGKAQIMVRVIVNRSMEQFGTKLSCRPELWNQRESRLNGKSHEAVELNSKIDKFLLAVNSAFDILLERKQPFNATAVKNLVQGSIKKQMTLLCLLDRHTKEMMECVGIDRTISSMCSYKYTRRSLGDFVKKKFKTGDVAFGQLSEYFIREYQEYCLSEKGLSMETVRHFLAILKKICKIAYKEGHSEKCYFSHYKLPKQKENIPKALSKEDFEKLRDLKITYNLQSYTITRDLFIFACYTGSAYADTVSITRKNLFTDDEGCLWLKYRRKKNDILGRVKLLPEAIALIDKYNDDSRDTLFPMQHYGTLRRNMKKLRIMADISQDVVYHMGRHSFASLITLEEGVPVETISKMLGHHNIKTTQIYAHVTPKRLFEDIDIFIEDTQGLLLVI